MKPNIDYASEIKALLTEKGLNQKELAQELGTSYINVNKTLNGHTMTARNRDRPRPPRSQEGERPPPRQAEQDKGDTGGVNETTNLTNLTNYGKGRHRNHRW